MFTREFFSSLTSALQSFCGYVLYSHIYDIRDGRIYFLRLDLAKPPSFPCRNAPVSE
jgi:hypothetical protein